MNFPRLFCPREVSQELSLTKDFLFFVLFMFAYFKIIAMFAAIKEDFTRLS